MMVADKPKQPPYLDREYYSRLGEEVNRGVEPETLQEMGYQSPLLDRLTSHLGTVASSGEVLQPVEEEPTKLEKFTTRFTWVPRYEQEINIALNGIEDTLAGKHISDVEKIVDNIRGYVRASNNTQDTLRQGLTDKDELSTVSVDTIRNYVDEYGHYGRKGKNSIVEAIATQLLFREEVLKGSGPWPKRSSGEGYISLNRLKPFIKMVNESSDEAILEMWKDTFNNQAVRAKFWLGIIASDNPHPRIREVQSERRDPTRGAFRR